jgi:hypothetical protein
VANSTDKSPQEIKRKKIVDEFQKRTGITFTGEQGNNFPFAQMLHDAVRVGARTIDPNKEDSPIHCSHEWHFARYTGPGSSLVPLLYGISFHLAGESGVFRPSLQGIQRYLNVGNADNIYAAAELLVTDGFWEVIERENGKPVKYRPVRHKDWAEQHPNRCTKKIEIDWVQEDEPLAALGRSLYAVLGGEKFHRNVLLGVRNAAPPNSTDEEIVTHGKKFLAADKGKGSGVARRKRFLEYLRDLWVPE